MQKNSTSPHTEAKGKSFAGKFKAWSRKLLVLSISIFVGLLQPYHIKPIEEYNTVVASTFIANALLDAYEITKEEPLLKMAKSTYTFIIKHLNRTYDIRGNFSFSYSPLDKSVVFNASLLSSRLLARVYSFTGEKELVDEAKKSVSFCCQYQKEDGSWGYGTLPFHQWVDNFHTGYNLECITDYMKFSGDQEYEEQVEKGFRYYINTFFTAEGIPKYYNNSVYPIDIHAPAQLVITLYN